MVLGATVLLVTLMVRVLQVLEWAEVPLVTSMLPLVMEGAMVPLVLLMVRVSQVMYRWCCRLGGCCRSCREWWCRWWSRW